MKHNFRQTARWALGVLALSLLMSSFAFGQETTGSIVGTVRDSAGSAVPGATVIITDAQKNNTVVRTMTTNDEGEFSAPNLQISIYQVTVEMANFKKSVNTEIKLDVGQRRTIDVTLEAGNISEVVTVESGALSVELTTPTASTLITGDQVRELSINNRNFVQLVTLAPGVSANLADQVYVGTTNPEGQANTVNISVNGARSSANTFTVDGADITDRGSNLTIQAYPSVDSIGEFKVLRSLYPAESGRSGGGQINVVTKSGTDEFHGSLFEFVRNEKFNANSFLNNRNSPSGRDENGKAIRPPFRYNNYGFTVGGPVYFFNFGERDPGEGMFKRYGKTYFFFSEEQRKDRRFPTFNAQVPNAGMRNGVFSVPICISGTISGNTRTCSQVLEPGMPITSLPGVTINPVAQAYLTNVYSQIPLPNVAPFGLVSTASAKADFQQEIIKFDTSLTKNWTAYYRYQRDSIPTIDVNSLFNSGSGIPGLSTSNTDSPGRTHTFQTTYVVSPKVIVEGRYVYSYGAIISETTGLLSRQRTPIDVPLRFPLNDDRIPQIAITNLATLQAFGPYNNFSDKNEWTGNVTWIFGSHTTKFGASFSKYRKNEDNGLGGTNQGAFSGFLNTTAASPTQGTVCVGTVNNVPNTPIACPAGSQTTQQAFANFLLGNNVTFLQTKFRLTADFRQRNVEAYAQDEYRVLSNLTLYYGLRYSFYGSPWARNGLLSNFVPELYNPAQAPLVNGLGVRQPGAGKNFCNGIIVNAQNYTTGPPEFNCTPTISPFGKYVVDAPKLNFAPRVGLAWDPFSNGKTAIRTGYGIYHEQTLIGTFETHLGTNPPYQETFNPTQVRLDQPVPTGAGVVASNNVPALVRGVDTDYKTPYYQHWSLDWQQQWFKNTITTIGYYGSKGTNLIGVVDINLLPPGYALTQTCATGASTTPTVPCQPRDPMTNQPIPFTANPSTILDQLRPYRGWRGISMIQPRFNSNYHSLQVSATQRFTGASMAQVAYTWSKNLTDNQTDRSTAPQNPYSIRDEYGRAQLDRRHIFTLNYIYEIPFFDKQNDFAGKVLGGWQASGIVTYQTGLPFTPTYAGFDPAGIGFLNASSPAGGRPYVLCDPNEGAPNTFAQFFNTSCFQTTTPTSGAAIPGNAPRGVIEGPRTFRVDFTLTKNIRFGESMRLQLRGEAFNVLNTTNFTTLALAASTPNTFGNVTGTRDPRTLQFGVKFYF